MIPVSETPCMYVCMYCTHHDPLPPTFMSTGSSRPIGAIHLPLLDQPTQQVDFRHHRHGLHPPRLPALLLRHDGRAVPLEEPRQRPQRRVQRDFHKLSFLRHALAVGLAVRFQRRRLRVRVLAAIIDRWRRRRRWGELSDIPRIRNDLADLGEVEHDVLDGTLARRAALADPAEHIPQGH